MANARTRFDTICDYMGRVHETSTGQVYGKPCAMFQGRAFIAFHMEGMGFKIRGRMRLQALALTGARFWDPLLPDRPDPEWVWIPTAYFLSWDRLAVESFRQQKEQGDLAVGRVRPSASAPLLIPRANTPAGASSSPPLGNGSRPAPPAPPPPATQRLPNWAERLKQLTGWTKWTTSGRESPP